MGTIGGDAYFHGPVSPLPGSRAGQAPEPKSPNPGGKLISIFRVWLRLAGCAFMRLRCNTGPPTFVRASPSPSRPSRLLRISLGLIDARDIRGRHQIGRHASTKSRFAAPKVYPWIARLPGVVEDEPLIALELQLALEEMGATVHCAGALPAALALAERTQFSAAIVDFQLGGERCEDLCTALTQRGVPFMFYTGGTEHGLANSAAPVVTKPASMQAVVAVLAPLVAKSRDRQIGKRATLHLF
jgi:CheY-like chemotaxis protein